MNSRAMGRRCTSSKTTSERRSGRHSVVGLQQPQEQPDVVPVVLEEVADVRRNSGEVDEEVRVVLPLGELGHERRLSDAPRALDEEGGRAARARLPLDEPVVRPSPEQGASSGLTKPISTQFVFCTEPTSSITRIPTKPSVMTH